MRRDGTAHARDKQCTDCPAFILRSSTWCVDCYRKHRLPLAQAKSLIVRLIGDRPLTLAEKKQRYRAIGKEKAAHRAWRGRKAAERQRLRLKANEIVNFDLSNFYPMERRRARLRDRLLLAVSQSK